MPETLLEKHIRRYFFWSVFLKGLISLGEVIGGIIVFFIPPAFFTGFVISWAQQELYQEPGDFIATHSLQIAQDFSVASTTIVAIYLLSRGIIKLGLVWALLKNQLWAYPASLVVLGAFILYQLYEIAAGHSIIWVIITLFDAVVVYFIWREWRIVEKHIKEGKSLY